MTQAQTIKISISIIMEKLIWPNEKNNKTIYCKTNNVPNIATVECYVLRQQGGNDWFCITANKEALIGFGSNSFNFTNK